MGYSSLWSIRAIIVGLVVQGTQPKEAQSMCAWIEFHRALPIWPDPALQAANMDGRLT